MIKRRFISDVYEGYHLRLRAFTLVELLVVISVIAMILGVLLPALNKAKQRARSMVCSSNMHQISMASLMYTQEHDGRFPRSSHSASATGSLRWGQALMPYLGCGCYKGAGVTWDILFRGLYHCPTDRRKNLAWSYGKNVWFELDSSETGEALGIPAGPTYSTLLKVSHPSTTVEFGELLSASAADHFMAHYWLMGAAPEIDANRHGRMSNYSYLDGRVLMETFEKTFVPDKRVDNWNPGTAAQ